MTIGQIKKYAEEIASSWNGEDSGMAEDRAGWANEVLEKIAELEELLKELNS